MQGFLRRISMIDTLLSVDWTGIVLWICVVALILCGVAPIERPAGVSRRIGLLAGRGGLPWALSRPEASGYKLEIVGRAAPAFFREIKAGYDYLTCWAGGWMTELFKLFARHDFFPIERAEYMGETLVRMEWRRM